MLVGMVANAGDTIDVYAVLREIVLDWALIVRVFVLLVNVIEG